MRFLLSTLFSTLLLAMQSATAAGPRVVMDFNAIVDDPNNSTAFASPYYEDGLVLVAGGGFYMEPHNAITGGARKSAYQGNAHAYLSVAGGGTFNFVSIRGRSRTSDPCVIEFIGTKPNGTTVSWAPGFQFNSYNGSVATLPVDFHGVTSVRFSYSSTYHYQYDDITVDLPDPVTGLATGTYSEGHGSIPVGLTLSKPQPTPVTVNYTIADATATAGNDYTLPGGLATGTLTVPAGQLSTQVLVPIINDTAVESPETFTVAYSALVGGYFASGTHTATITVASDDGIANFAGWMAAHGVVGNAALPYADANGDGIPNIETWLYRINPAGVSPSAWLDRRAGYYGPASTSPGLRFTLPTPLPSDVRLIFEETTALSTPWSEQTRRSGFGVGSLWTGSGASRITESTTLTSRTFTLPGSAARSARPRAFYRMKYELLSGSVD